jgi:hypothetical protein
VERLFSHILVPKEVINEFLIKDGGCRWMNKITTGAVADHARGVAELGARAMRSIYPRPHTDT